MSSNIDKLKSENKNLAKYLVYYLSIMYTITTTLLAIDNSKEADEKRVKLWQNLKKVNPNVYKRIRYFSKAFFMSLPGPSGKKISRGLYRIARRVYKFN